MGPDASREPVYTVRMAKDGGSTAYALPRRAPGAEELRRAREVLEAMRAAGPKLSSLLTACARKVLAAA